MELKWIQIQIFKLFQRKLSRELEMCLGRSSEALIWEMGWLKFGLLSTEK